MQRFSSRLSELLRSRVIPQRQTVDAGEPVSLNCTITGHPLTAVSWLKDGYPLLDQPGRVAVLTTLVQIVEMRREDRGMYQCFAENDEVAVQATAEIRLGSTSA